MSTNYIDADYDTPQDRKGNRPVRMSQRTSVARRPKASRSRGGSTGAATNGGIRQRRNKRWAW